MSVNISFAIICVNVNFLLYNLILIQSKIFPTCFVEDGNTRPILSSQSSSCFLATKRESMNSKNFNNNNVKPEFYGQQSPICHNPFKHEKEPSFNMSSHINNMAVMAQVKMMMMIMMMVLKFCMSKI